MKADLDTLIANLSRPELSGSATRSPPIPSSADGLGTMLAGLPPDTQAQIMRRLAAHLEHTPLGRGAVLSALADVIEHRLRQDR